MRSVLGIRSDKQDRGNPTGGKGWKAILDCVDAPGVASDFLSVADTQRLIYGTHPWNIGGGGAVELLEAIVKGSKRTLTTIIESIGSNY